MKKLIKKAVAVFTCVALSLSMFTAVTASAATTNYYNTYSKVASIGNRNSCTVMQGIAVGSTWLYTVKIKSDNTSAILQKTNKNTGATTNLTDSNGSATYSYLNHANDMDVTTIDGYSQLYIATMATGSKSLVRMKINGSKATKVGSYTIKLDGEEKSVSAVSIIGTTDTHVNFLFKKGTQFYSGSVAKSATSGTINITPVFKINISSVKVNGSTLNLSSYTHQGMGYYSGKLFVPLWGGGASKDNVAIVAVYDVSNASGTVTSDPNLSFRITSSAYKGFELESCDISSDGKLYFNANRWTSSSGNYDGVFYFNEYKFVKNTNTAETTQAATEATTEPVTEPTTEPVIEPATEATTQPVTEPATEPTTEVVTEPTTSSVKYFPACSSSQTSLVSALNSVGAQSSFSYRKTIAASNGITGYSGTAAQNTQMLNLLKQGKLIVP